MAFLQKVVFLNLRLWVVEEVVQKKKKKKSNGISFHQYEVFPQTPHWFSLRLPHLPHRRSGALEHQLAASSKTTIPAMLPDCSSMLTALAGTYGPGGGWPGWRLKEETNRAAELDLSEIARTLSFLTSASEKQDILPNTLQLGVPPCDKDTA